MMIIVYRVHSHLHFLDASHCMNVLSTLYFLSHLSIIRSTASMGNLTLKISNRSTNVIFKLCYFNRSPMEINSHKMLEFYFRFDFSVWIEGTWNMEYAVLTIFIELIEIFNIIAGDICAWTDALNHPIWMAFMQDGC